MILSNVSSAHDCNGIPRVCGGDPAGKPLDFSKDVYSPRMRGGDPIGEGRTMNLYKYSPRSRVDFFSTLCTYSELMYFLHI